MTRGASSISSSEAPEGSCCCASGAASVPCEAGLAACGAGVAASGAGAGAASGTSSLTGDAGSAPPSSSSKRNLPSSSTVMLSSRSASASAPLSLRTFSPRCSITSTMFRKPVSFPTSRRASLSASRCRAPQPRQVATTTPDVHATRLTEIALRTLHFPHVYARPNRSLSGSCRLALLPPAGPSASALEAAGGNAKTRSAAASSGGLWSAHLRAGHGGRGLEGQGAASRDGLPTKAR